MERLRQTHAKEVESRDEEVEEIRQSCQKKVRRVLGTSCMPFQEPENSGPVHSGVGRGSSKPSACASKAPS